MFLQNVSFFYSFMTLSWMNSGQDIKFVLNKGYLLVKCFPEIGLIFPSLQLVSHVRHHSFFASFSILGEMKNSLTCIGVGHLLNREAGVQMVN